MVFFKQPSVGDLNVRLVYFWNTLPQKESSFIVGLSGLRVMCLPRDPRFAGSNPAEVDGFFQDVKILSTSPPGGTLSWES